MPSRQAPDRSASLNPLESRGNYSATSNIGWYTLAVDGWAVTFGRARRGLGAGRSPPRPLLVVPNVTAHPWLNGQCTNHRIALRWIKRAITAAVIQYAVLFSPTAYNNRLYVISPCNKETLR